MLALTVRSSFYCKTGIKFTRHISSNCVTKMASHLGLFGEYSQEAMSKLLLLLFRIPPWIKLTRSCVLCWSFCPTVSLLPTTVRAVFWAVSLHCSPVSYIRQSSASAQSSPSLQVLETCVKNCGHRFHVQVANRDFIDGVLVKIISPKTNPPTIVQDKVLSLIQVLGLSLLVLYLVIL